jgi:hypothetical protein
MYEVSFFKKKSDPMTFVVTLDRTGSILPDASEWKLWFRQMVYPEYLNPASELHRWQTAFARDVYYDFPDRAAADRQ